MQVLILRDANSIQLERVARIAIKPNTSVISGILGVLRTMVKRAVTWSGASKHGSVTIALPHPSLFTTESAGQSESPK